MTCSYMYIMYFDHRPPPLFPSLSPPFGVPLIFKWFFLYFHLFLIHIWSVRENMQHLSFCICLISLSVWFQFCHIHNNTIHLFMVKKNSIVCIHMCTYIHTYNMHIIYLYIYTYYITFLKYSHLLDASGLVPFFGYYIGAIVSVSVQYLCCVLT